MKAEYAFCQPLIRAVAHESQLKSDRAELHRRLATAIEAGGSVEENAALIAEHLEAAGDVHGAYAWHMRAGAWSTNRNIAAACLSWERARHVADEPSADEPSADEANRIAMRIAPRTLFCGNAWRIHVNVVDSRFEELRQLCTLAGDKPAGMTSLCDTSRQTSFGPGYRSVWHRDPTGVWTFYATTRGLLSCARYFSAVTPSDAVHPVSG